MNGFRLYSPGSLEDACGFLAEHGSDAAVYAGGTELLLAMKEGLMAPAFLVDVKPLGLDRIEHDADGRELRLGATATHRAIEAWCAGRASWSTLAELERQVANVRVRNQGTIGGNLCFAEPHADPGVLLAAWGANVEIVNPHGVRRLPVTEFLVDEFTTALEDGEIMTAVGIPEPPPRSASAYLRFGFLERPSLGVAAWIALDEAGQTVADAAIAVGAVGPCPERLDDAAQALIGADIRGDGWTTAAGIAAAHAADACQADGDAHGAEDYKRHLVGVFVRRALESCRDRAEGQGEIT